MIYPRPTQSSEFIKKTYDGHRAVIAAIKDRDAALCERLIKEDVGMTKKILD